MPVFLCAPNISDLFVQTVFCAFNASAHCHRRTGLPCAHSLGALFKKIFFNIFSLSSLFFQKFSLFYRFFNFFPENTPKKAFIFCQKPYKKVNIFFPPFPPFKHSSPLKEKDFLSFFFC